MKTNIIEDWGGHEWRLNYLKVCREIVSEEDLASAINFVIYCSIKVIKMKDVVQ